MRRRIRKDLHLAELVCTVTIAAPVTGQWYCLWLAQIGLWFCSCDVTGSSPPFARDAVAIAKLVAEIPLHRLQQCRSVRRRLHRQRVLRCRVQDVPRDAPRFKQRRRENRVDGIMWVARGRGCRGSVAGFQHRHGNQLHIPRDSAVCCDTDGRRWSGPWSRRGALLRQRFGSDRPPAAAFNGTQGLNGAVALWSSAHRGQWTHWTGVLCSHEFPI